MARTPEGKVKDDVKKVLKEFGIWYYMPVQNGMGRVGIPDFVCCDNGRFLTIETKAPGKTGSLTENQLRVTQEINAAGGATIVTDNAETVRRYITATRVAFRMTNNA